MAYKKAIHIEGKNLDDVFRLPCVRKCTKSVVAGIIVFEFYPLLMAHPKPFQKAYTGDWLCLDESDKWHVLNDSQYKNLEK